MFKGGWSKNEELNFVKDIAGSKTLEELSIKYVRSKEELEHRLSKIIHDNLLSGKSLDKISVILKMPIDKVHSLFNSYIAANASNGVSGANAGNGVNGANMGNIVNGANAGNGGVSAVNMGNIVNGANMGNIVSGVNAIHKPNMSSLGLGKVYINNTQTNCVDNFKFLENENKIMKIIIENKNLKKEINDLIKLGRIHKDVLKLIQDFCSAS